VTKPAEKQSGARLRTYTQNMSRVQELLLMQQVLHAASAVQRDRRNS
jgi:hypothetical protein